MELNVAVSGSKEVAAALAAIPGKAHRACAIALNKAGKIVKEAEVAEMKSVFDNPTRYTLNSLQLTPATKNDLNATVWFKEPDRMGAHYLVPQVEGGQRNLKGFELGVGLGELVPTRVGAQINAYGNMSVGQIKQVVSVLGKSESSAGYASNITKSSAKRNTKQRDYLVINKGNKSGLTPGVYQRFAQIGKGIDTRTSRKFGLRGARAYQYGKSKGKWRSVTRARGLRPVLLVGRTGHQVKPRLDFYSVAHLAFNQHFEPLFWSTLNTFLKS